MSIRLPYLLARLEEVINKNLIISYSSNEENRALFQKNVNFPLNDDFFGSRKRIFENLVTRCGSNQLLVKNPYFKHLLITLHCIGESQELSTLVSNNRYLLIHAGSQYLLKVRNENIDSCLKNGLLNLDTVFNDLVHNIDQKEVDSLMHYYK